MLDFESLLEDAIGRKPKKEGAAERKGERNITIRYKEDEPNKPIIGGVNKENYAEQALVLMYAAGKVLGYATGLDGEKLGDILVRGVTKGMLNLVMEDLFKCMD